MQKFLFYFFGLIIVGLIALLIFIQSEEMQNFGIRQFIKKIEKETGWVIEIDSVKVSLPLHITAKKVTIAQFDKIWLEINHLNLCISLTDLLEQNLTIYHAFADTVKLNGLPKINPETEIPLPPYLRVSDLEVSHFYIGSELIPSNEFLAPDKPLEAKASFDLDRDHRRAVLNLTLKDEKLEETHLIANGSLLENHAEIHLEASRTAIGSAGGIIKIFDDSRINIESIQAIVGQLEVKGKVELDSHKRLDGSDLSFVYHANSQVENYLPIPIKGDIHGTCVLFGQLDSPDAHIEVESPTLDIAELIIKDLKSEIDLQYKQGMVNGEGRLAFEGLNQSIQAKTAFKYLLQKEFRLTKFQLKSPGVNIGADLTVFLPDFLIEGRFNSEMRDLEWVKSLYGEEIQGSLQATGELFIVNSGTHDQQGIEFAVNSRDCRQVIEIRRGIFQGIDSGSFSKSQRKLSLFR